MEEVLVIKESDWHNLQQERYNLEKLLKESFFLERPKAETSPEYKQIIPYVIVKQKDKYLTYKRTKLGGEDRLHEKYSIGIGGHINLNDMAQKPIDIFNNGMTREVEEELDICESTFKTISIENYLYDDSNHVGQVHIGIPYIFTPNSKEEVSIRIKESELTELQWLTKEELSKLSNLENWSKIVLEYL